MNTVTAPAVAGGTAASWFSLLLPLAGFYVMFALCLMKMALRDGHPCPWLAWIPLANLFLMVQLAGKRKFGLGVAFLVLLFIGVGGYVTLFVYAIPQNSLIAGAPWLIVPTVLSTFAVYVLYCILLYNLYRRFRPCNATVYTVLSAIFPVLSPIFILVAAFSTYGQGPSPPQGPSFTPPGGPQGPTFTPPSGY